MKKVVLSFSGGIDSSALLLWYVKKKYVIEAVAFQYGSLHNQYELVSARKIVKLFPKVTFTKIDVSPIFSKFTSALLDGSPLKIPETSQKDFSTKPTIIPFRNAIFMSVLVGFAESKGIRIVAMGLHKGRLGYLPDARPEFAQAFQAMALWGASSHIEIETPFIYCNKTEIVEWGLKNKLPFHLTRTCYKHQQKSCGKCGACVERLEAFKNNEVKDPIKYV